MHKYFKKMEKYLKKNGEKPGFKLYIKPEEETRFLTACIDKNMQFNRVAYEKFKKDSSEFPYRYLYCGLISYGATKKAFHQSKYKLITIDEFEIIKGFDYIKDFLKTIDEEEEMTKENCRYCSGDYNRQEKNYWTRKCKCKYNIVNEVKLKLDKYDKEDFLLACLRLDLSLNPSAEEKILDIEKYPYVYIKDNIVALGYDLNTYNKSKYYEIIIEDLICMDSVHKESVQPNTKELTEQIRKQAKEKGFVIPEKGAKIPDKCGHIRDLIINTDFKEQIYNICVEHKIMYKTFKSLMEAIDK